MKKSLALLLALLMLFSVALVSCTGNEESTDTDDDFIFNPGKNTDDGTGTDDGDGTGNGTSGTSDNLPAASGTVYFLYSFKVRKAMKSSSSSSNIIGTVEYGSSAELVGANDTWSKIKFTSNGGTKEGYVYTGTYTNNQSEVKYTPYEGETKSAKVNTTGLNVRTTPWVFSGNVDEYKTCNIVADINNNVYSSLKKDTALTILGEVKNASGTVTWYYVTYEVTGNDNNVHKGQGYVSASLVLVEGQTTPTTPSEGETNPVITPV